MKLKLATILAFTLILILVIASCSTPPPDAGQDSNLPDSAEGSDVSESPVSTEPVKQPLFSNLPDKSYEGKTITFLVEGDYMDTYKSVEIVPHEDSYESLNTAVSARNDLVSERFGVEFAEVRTTGYGDMLSKLRTSLTSGTNEYDIVMPYFPQAATFAQEGGLIDLRTLQNVHLSESYYDQGSVNDLSILNKNYFVTGDLSLLSYDVTHVLVFDKNLVKNYNLDDPYTLVKNRKFTIDKMWEMSKVVQADIDGDTTVMGYKDQYGFLVNRNYTSTLFIGCGQRFTGKNENDEPVITVYSPQSVTVFNKVYDFINDPSSSGKIDFTSGGFWTTSAADGKNIWEAARDSSGNGLCLFHSISLNGILKIGEYDCSFGLLPAPLFDDKQERYYNRVSTIYGTCAAIPLNVADPEMSSIILDAMMQASTDTVRVAYFDVIMKDRKIQDYDSEEMLDIILDTRVYDFGSIYNWGQNAHGQTIFMAFMDGIGFEGPNTFVSTWESIETAVNQDLNNTLEIFKSLD